MRILKRALPLVLCFIFSWAQLASTQNKQESLPQSPLEVVEVAMKRLSLHENYKIENKHSPRYLQKDFNGDDFLDIAVWVSEHTSGKEGVMVMHGPNQQAFVIGAGVGYYTVQQPNGPEIWDNLDWVSSWKTYQQATIAENYANESGELNSRKVPMPYPGIKVEEPEVGGATIMWNGSHYIYIHQGG